MKVYLTALAELGKLSTRGHILELLEVINSPIIGRDGCVLLENLIQNSTQYMSTLHHDRTGYECFINHIHTKDFISSKKINPLVLLKTGLLIGEMLAKSLAFHKPEESFKIIIAYDGCDCTARFHKVRPLENWLTDDLEFYELDGIYAIEI